MKRPKQLTPEETERLLQQYQAGFDAGFAAALEAMNDSPEK